jgi:hypothetical protein
MVAPVARETWGIASFWSTQCSLSFMLHSICHREDDALYEVPLVAKFFAIGSDDIGPQAHDCGGQMP